MDEARLAVTAGARGWVPPARLEGLPPYPLADVPDIKARLRAEGRSVVDLGVGDPGLPVPEVALEALRASAGDPALSKYGFQRGLPEYRLAIAGWLSRRFGADVDPDLLLPGSAMGPGGDGFARASLTTEEDGWADAGLRIREAL